MAESLYRYRDGPLHGYPVDADLIRESRLAKNDVIVVDVRKKGEPHRATYRIDHARLVCTYISSSR